MNNPLLDEYDRLQAVAGAASQAEAKAQAAHNAATIDHAAAVASACKAQAELKRMRGRLSTALGTESQRCERPSQASTTSTLKIPRSVAQTMAVFPAEGSALKLEAIRRALDLSEGATNTRLQKAIRKGVLERCGYGLYRLTDQGIALVATPRLKVVQTPTTSEG